MSGGNDPFFPDDDGDKTIIKPRPGGRGGAGGAPSGARPPAPPPPPSGPPPGGASGPPPPSSRQALNVAMPGDNVLLNSARSLITLATNLRYSTSHSDPKALNQHVAAEIRNFEARAQQAGCKPEHVVAARYALCTFIDEVVMSTPWGAHSGWSEQTLLSTFHREGWGGEKFFAILDRICANPGANTDLIELLHYILLLGFQGKYRVSERGDAEIKAIVDRLSATLKNFRGKQEAELSPTWRGVQDLRSPLQQYVPLWVVAVGCAALLLGLFMVFNFTLSRHIEPVLTELQVIGRDRDVLVDRTASRGRRLNLAGMLAPEIAQGLVEVEDRPGRSIVTLNGDGLFASGRASLSADRVALVERVAEVLQTERGKIAVVGHTDNTPISGSLRLRFPTNFDLSDARAGHIVDRLTASGVALERLSYEGRGATEPLVDNNTPANRAKNRRVEITLSVRSRQR